MRNRLGKSSLLFLVAIFLIFIGALFWLRPNSQETNTGNRHSSQHTCQQVETKASTSKLPDSSPSEWNLRLVNREHLTPELNPDLAMVGPIQVDSRIAQEVSDFLAAAQALDPAFHLISGYRSVAYQKDLFQSYVNQEKANDPSLSDDEARDLVQTYSQPAGASEHQTGLAIDLSTVDALNQADKAVMAKVHALAPRYGFVLRFPEGKTAVTGVSYEDWHFRYVGKRTARYMTDHQLTLEEYLEQLEEKTP